MAGLRTPVDVEDLLEYLRLAEHPPSPVTDAYKALMRAALVRVYNAAEHEGRTQPRADILKDIEDMEGQVAAADCQSIHTLTLTVLRGLRAGLAQRGRRGASRATGEHSLSHVDGEAGGHCQSEGSLRRLHLYFGQRY
ncbi:uncharacterized protein RHOBADRAFT_55184 [Rhodotorula graminis WP1]|uniref:Uncharacterized protein n=1 Tax=Rhodotorula graminis (strain WP1) TaxID=578459 RepID=A0A0P9EIZ3_RHOGW|nr:uncharacterized protein RHOBADRAFT_55184 [Rhodotorula graminis WP1]KPV73446.1 hypothetical protein RHOBADRAFT_55184 [Rhodotorula graminis WP1]